MRSTFYRRHQRAQQPRVPMDPMTRADLMRHVRDCSVILGVTIGAMFMIGMGS